MDSNVTANEVYPDKPHIHYSGKILLHLIFVKILSLNKRMFKLAVFSGSV